MISGDVEPHRSLAGVPQGSILGLILFVYLLDMIDDLAKNGGKKATRLIINLP